MKTPPPKTWKIITNCSNKKRGIGSVLSPNLRIRDLNLFIEDWYGKVVKAKQIGVSVETYVGRSVTEVKQVSSVLSAEIYFVSAGLGLVNGEKEIPLYNLTVSPGTNTLFNWLKGNSLVSADWWHGLNNRLYGDQFPISKLVNESNNVGFMICLPSTYINMVKEDLSFIKGLKLKNIRIFTSETGQSTLPEELRTYSLPYSGNLEGLEFFNGTQNDFPQRAMRHFVSSLGGENLDIEISREMVAREMNSLRKPIIPTRKKLDDAEITKLIRSNWKKFKGSRDKLHKFIRREKLVACEQNRFGILWNAVKQDMLKVSI